MLVVIPFFTYLLGTCWLFYFIADDVTNDLIAFNETVTTIAETPNGRERAELMKTFSSTIQIYTDAKRYGWEIDDFKKIRFISRFRCVQDFNELYKYALFAFYIWTMMSFCSSLVAIQFQLVEWIFEIDFISCVETFNKLN